MINFLRKLRREGVNTRYIKYAIGEIALVVIGILIALAINQSVEKNQRNNIGKAYLESLYNELLLDSARFERVDKDLLMTENASRRLAAVVEDPNHHIKDSAAFIIDFRTVLNRTQDLPEPVVWKELQNTGNMGLLKRHIIERLYMYYSGIENCQEDYENNVLPFVLRGRYLDSKIFSVSEQDDLFDNFKLDSKIRADVYKDLVTNEEFDHVVHGMVSGSIISRKILTGAKVSVKMLLDLINEELKN